MSKVYWFFAAIVLLVAAAGIFVAQNNRVHLYTPPADASVTEQAVGYVNEYRSKMSLPPVVANAALTSLAQNITIEISVSEASTFTAYVQAQGTVEGQSKIQKFLIAHGYPVATFGEVYGYTNAGGVIHDAVNDNEGAQFSRTIGGRFTDIGAATGYVGGLPYTFILLATHK